MAQNKYTTNNDPLLAAASNVDGETPVYLYADPSTHRLNTESVISSIQNVVSTLNSTNTPLGSNATFTGAFEDVKNFSSLSLLVRTDKDSATDGLKLQWSDDGVNVRRESIATMAGNTANGYYFSVGRQGRYYRFTYTNGSDAQTVFAVEITHEATQGGGAYIPIGSNLSSLYTGLLTRSVITGQQPDGDYVNASADGLAFENSTNLGSNAVFTSAWFDTDQWRSLEVFIATDKVSADNGIEIQFTDNVQTATPVVRATIYRTFSAADVTRGYVIYRPPALLDGVRIKYTNGATAQTNMYMALNLRSFAVENPQTTLDGQLALSDTSLLSRSVLTGLSTPDGTEYNNLTVVPQSNVLGTYYSIPVVTGARPSDIPGRTAVTKNIANVTADTQIHTNTATKTFYLTDIIGMVENDLTSGGVAYIRDGTSAAGTIMIPLRVDAKQGSATKQTTFSHTFTEPIAFSSGVYYDEATDLTTSITIVVYEE